MEKPTLFLGCADLFFATRIETTARKLGYRIQRLGGLPGGEELAIPPRGIAILDLDGAGDPLAWIHRFRERGDDFPVFAFVRHDETERIKLAREAGASRVFARGAFTQKLPDLLKRGRGDNMAE